MPALFRLHHAETRISYAYGALNLAYLVAALVGAFYWPRFTAAMVAYIVLRSMLLATIEAQWNLPALTYRDANARTVADFLDVGRAAFMEPPTIAEPPAPVEAVGTP